MVGGREGGKLSFCKHFSSLPIYNLIDETLDSVNIPDAVIINSLIIMATPS